MAPTNPKRKLCPCLYPNRQSGGHRRRSDWNSGGDAWRDLL